ncbi:MAG TPA: cation-translocating P-type ATPase [Bacillota bacterium]
MSDEPLYSLEPAAVAGLLRTDLERGLSAREAERRLDEVGPNTLKEAGGVSPLAIILEQFSDFMVLVLLGATVVSFLLGEISDAVTIIAIVIINAVLGFVQEYRAERSLAALRELTAPTARVVRDRAEFEVDAATLVPGDLVMVEAGDQVPADLRLIEASSLAAEEAALTGESHPVRKTPRAVAADQRPTLGEQGCMLFMGSVITRGRGRGLVVKTGMSTEMGLIAGMIQESGEEETPLQRRLEQLGKYIVAACLVICGVVVVVGVRNGESIYRMFLAGVSLAVAAIPEGLPAIVTIALALGVQRMSKRQAIVRRLPAVETLGCATVVCSDKTGTLTENQMTVRRIIAGHRSVYVSGTGYSPKGRFYGDGREPLDPRRNEALRLALLVGALCADARLAPGGIKGDPTEGALVVAAAKAGLLVEEIEAEWPRVAEIPFESERRRMTTFHRVDGGLWLLCKGAADTVIDLCTRFRDEAGERALFAADRHEILKANEEMAGDALRVLGLAARRIPAGDPRAAAVLGGRTEAEDLAPLERDLCFIGLVGMIDPPRKEVYRAVQTCQRAGVRTVMITGDHWATARAIAQEIGILETTSISGGAILTGRELDKMSDRELARAAQTARVYARVSPHHKLRIVRALKQKGQVVAMTGDGVNDAPAVKEADIGVAMGLSGTDVTKEASSMVLADDNFATIVAAIEEGRAIYDNIRKFIRYLLSCNVGEILVMFLAAVAGLPLPLIPIQILMVNLVTDGLPAMALGVEPPEPDVADRPPRPPQESVFARRLAIKISVRGLMIGLATLIGFWVPLHVGAPIEHARTLAFATLVSCQLIHVFDCRSERRSLLKLGFFTNPLLIGAVAVSTAMMLGTIYLPGMQPVFKTTALTVGDWLWVLILSGGPNIFVSLRRVFIYHGKERIWMQIGRGREVSRPKEDNEDE